VILLSRLFACLQKARIIARLFYNTYRDQTMVIIRTTFGEIKLELDAEKAPKTVENFLSYAQEGYYDGTIFHRVIDNFMIQGGGFDTSMAQKPTGEPVENEADNGLKNDFGTVAMARTTEPGYTVFGKVTEGDEVLDKIRGVATASRSGHQDVPVEDVIIESVTVVEA
jgi:peptidyl-prolyl cis-trans isomerase B (cyclophilin B)